VIGTIHIAALTAIASLVRLFMKTPSVSSSLS
jgi:hypothetical protein